MENRQSDTERWRKPGPHRSVQSTPPLRPPASASPAHQQALSPVANGQRFSAQKPRHNKSQQRPSSQRSATNGNRQRGPPQPIYPDSIHKSEIYVPKAGEPTWIEIDSIPPSYNNPTNLHRVLFNYGHVSRISCYDKFKASALLTFARPALFDKPTLPGGWKLIIKGRPYKFDMVESPANSASEIQEKTIVPVDRVEFGVMTDEHHMMVMHTVSGVVDHPAVLMLDLHSEARHSLHFRFFLSTEPEAPWYSAELPLSSPLRFKHIRNSDGQKEMVITSQFPPKWWQSVGRDLLEEVHQTQPNSHKYFEWPRGWRRVTDIDLNPDERDLSPVAFVPPSPVVDTGRWLTWKLKFSPEMDDLAYNTIVEVLEARNAAVQECNPADFDTVPREDPVVWDLLDPHQASYESDLHEMQDEMMHLGQDIRYQLEVCISNNKIIEYTMSREFLSKLSALDRDFLRDPNNPSVVSPALVLLENVADSKRTFFNPMDIFETYELRYPRKRRIPKGCVLMRTAIITPTTFYVKTPTVEVSNRVVRENIYAVDNFLRVKFEDEDPFGRLMPVAKYENQHEVWARIERCLRHGIDIAGRHYDWLACGNSQFRERGAYFFAPYSEEKTARNIRMSLGDFSSINIVAKCMARIGQCFSTTRASTGFGDVKATLIKDIERNGYCFTDGVGKMSKFIAQMVANELYADSAPDDHPSAFQFRMRGFKGILVVDPGLKGNTVHVRPSQRKFDARGSDKLEIIKPSKFSSSTLNQQLILVLTSRGVPKQIFVDKMTKELQDIDLAMTDEAMALEMLQKNVDFNHITLTMSGMILDGFMDADEPMCQILLQLWRTWNLKHLKEKAKLFIEKGAFVLGCVDETNTLKMCPGELPQIFIQVPGEKEGEWKTAQGICLLARNPSLHPGDIRVVRAVQCEPLKHLKNVVVLPQQGERPLANMCSGGDLDGDDYLVMWDDDLLPPTGQWNSEPMNYDPPTPVMCAGPVQDEQFVKFFIDYIKNDNLGSIATSHRVLADEFGSDGGVAHDTCKELAQLHSKAVDFNKTGVPAIMAEHHWPRKYPHWMPWKPKAKQRVSKQVIGVLFDMVQPQPFVPQLEKPFDKRILDAYTLSDSHLEKAREFKLGYDQQMRRIMVQHNIKTEFEVWTAFVMDHNREQGWFTLAEDLGNLMSSIKADYQSQVREYLGLADSGYVISEKAFGILGPFVAAMYTVTEQEVARWKESKLVSIDEDTRGAPLITYPWLFSRELGKIATRQSGPSALQAAFAANGGIRRRAPIVKSSYKTELHSIKLEPLAEWKPEHAASDRVGKTAFDVAAVDEVEKEILQVGQSESLEEEMVVDGGVVEEEVKEGVSEDEAGEQQVVEEEGADKGAAEEAFTPEESEEEGAWEEAPEEEEEAEEEKMVQDGVMEKEAEAEEAEEVEDAFDRLMAMTS
ncbi:RdRP-domain-containing protein, partial [Aureobasidium melanogenum]